MPWVFKRPWPTAGIQTVDGDDRPTYCYYAVKNAYSPLRAVWVQKWSIIAPREPLSLTVKTLGEEESLAGATVRLTVYRPDLTVAAAYEASAARQVDFGAFVPDESFTDTCFLVCVDLWCGKEVLSRAVYFNKCTSLFADEALYRKYRETPAETLRFEHGPWLKASVKGARPATLAAEIVSRGREGRYCYADVKLKNVSNTPAYPVTLDLSSDTGRCFLSDNFFLLAAGEEKTVRLTCDKGTVEKVAISWWNGEGVTVD